MNKLKVKEVSYEYPGFKALDKISFEVGDGLIGILGPNGAGKTTLMRLLTTLFSLQNGEIALNNLDYKKNIKEVRKELGYLPQNFEVYNTLTGREFLEIIASLKCSCKKEEIKKQVSSVIEEMGMKEYIDKKIKGYSGGMKQKLGFAQVLIGNPKMIVLDEPTVGLDPEQRNMIRELFPIISENRMVFVTTHIVEDIEYYCNFLIVIKEGKILYKGSKEDLIKRVENIIWETKANKEEYKRIRRNGKIITTVHENKEFNLKYISKEPLTKQSKSVKPNLQEAYIAYGNFEIEDKL